MRLRPAYLLIMAAILIFTVKFANVAWHDHGLAVQVGAVQTHLSQESANNKALRREIRDYRAPNFIYQAARRWGYVLPGDRLVNIYYHQLPRRHRAIVHQPAASVPPWRQWLNAFFGGTGN